MAEPIERIAAPGQNAVPRLIEITGELPLDLLLRAQELEEEWEALHGPRIAEPVIATPKVGRNERCPCGSAKKYKKCCLLAAGAPTFW